MKTREDGVLEMRPVQDQYVQHHLLADIAGNSAAQARTTTVDAACWWVRPDGGTCRVYVHPTDDPTSSLGGFVDDGERMPFNITGQRISVYAATGVTVYVEAWGY